MSEKFKGLYRNETFRAQWWDYRSEGSYHITICTENRVHYFGEIINEQMCLSEIGKLAHQFWSEIPKHFPHIQLDEFVIMPNHIHGILIIRDSPDADFCRDVALQHPTVKHPPQNVPILNTPFPIENGKHNESHFKYLDWLDEINGCIVDENFEIDHVDFEISVDVAGDVAVQHPYKREQSFYNSSAKNSPSYFSNIAPKSGSISVVIRSFKSVVSKHAHRIHADFQWQKLFHDRIIRDCDEFIRVKYYIRNNPKNWGKPRKRKKSE
jgi:REP element-mobilizing transposase RayT